MAAVILFDWWSIVRSMSVTRRPNEAALVTSLPAIVQMYGWCVWALTITATRGSRPCAIDSISGPLKFTQRFTSVYSSPVGGAGKAGGAGGRWVPPWCRSTTNAFTPCSLRSCSTSALTVATSGRKSSPSTALGVTTVGVPSNVRPMKAIFALPTLRTSYGGRIVMSVSA